MTAIKYFAGIGSRETPPDIMDIMKKISTYLLPTHWLRSGGAEGADTAFYSGRDGIDCEIFRANDATPEAIELASMYHPAWDRCTPFVKKLHGRNSMIILGRKLDSFVSSVICWTPDGGPTGGTGLGIRIAQAYRIPIYNLYHTDARNTILDVLKAKRV